MFVNKFNYVTKLFNLQRFVQNIVLIQMNLTIIRSVCKRVYFFRATVQKGQLNSISPCHKLISGHERSDEHGLYCG